MLLAGCNSTPPVHLAPIPAPPPVIVKVPTLVALPADLTEPCPEPTMPVKGVKTDVDLYIAAAEWRKAAKCANGRLTAIKEAQP
jgi:hypothetical protein